MSENDESIYVDSKKCSIRCISFCIAPNLKYAIDLNLGQCPKYWPSLTVTSSMGNPAISNPPVLGSKNLF